MQERSGKGRLASLILLFVPLLPLTGCVKESSKAAKQSRTPPGITVVPTAGLETTESGGTDNFTVVL